MQHIIFKQYICNKCSLLFKYRSKSVKMKDVKIKLLYLKNYDYLALFIKEDIKKSYYQYLFKKYSKKRKRVLFYQRNKLSKILDEIDLNKRKSMLLIEVL